MHGPSGQTRGPLAFWPRLSFLVLSTVLFNKFLISADSLTPRGVPLSRAALYDPQKEFSCLDGSKLIPFSFVNDDFCDCTDGSDEPGTSACSRGSFFCVNQGHASMYIPTSRVNDQICDCCSGEDEFSGDVSCENTCDEMGRMAREEAERQSRLAREGFQKRGEMSQKGKDSRREKEEERNRLEAERQRIEAMKLEKAKLKEEAEAPEKEALDRYHKLEEERKKLEDDEEKRKSENEAEDMFKLLDSNEDGKITVDEIKVRQTFDRNKDGVVSDEEATFFLNLEPEMSKEDFLKTGWLLAKPYFLMEQGMFQPPEPEKPEETQEQDQATETPGEDYEDDEADDLKEPDIKTKDDSDSAANQDASVEENEGGSEEHSEPEKAESSKYDEETQALIANADKARAEFHEVEKQERDIAQKLQEVNDVLNLDFGDDERFAPLHGLCFDFEDREYIYTLCPFKDANQRGKNGGGTVNLGKWGSWSGPESNKYSQMLYERGQGCWNGPARIARVSITCGIENRVISVSEPSRCEYLMEFTSPSVCNKPDQLQHDHDEL